MPSIAGADASVFQLAKVIVGSRGVLGRRGEFSLSQLTFVV